MADAGIDQISQLKKDDVVIALMGITGSGKSTFISLLSEDFVQIGHELTSCKLNFDARRLTTYRREANSQQVPRTSESTNSFIEAPGVLS